MKSSFSIFELIISLIVSSVIIIYSAKYLKEIYLENKNVQNIEVLKVDLNSTKIFLQRNIDKIDKISFSTNNLYFDNNLLLSNVKDFQISKKDNYVDIFINLDDKIVQNWKIHL